MLKKETLSLSKIKIKEKTISEDGIITIKIDETSVPSIENASIDAKMNINNEEVTLNISLCGKQKDFVYSFPLPGFDSSSGKTYSIPEFDVSFEIGTVDNESKKTIVETQVVSSKEKEMTLVPNEKKMAEETKEIIESTRVTKPTRSRTIILK